MIDKSLSQGLAMFRIFALTVFLTPLSAFSQLINTYYFSAAPNCSIKEYNPGSLTPVDSKKFQGTPLKAKKLNRNPQFMAFKVAGKIYIAPAACLKSTSMDSLEELDVDSFDETGMRDTRDYGNRFHSADHGQKKIKQEKTSTGFKNDYYVELDLGIVAVGGKEITYPNYQEFAGVTTEGTDTTTLNVGEAEGSSYKTKMAINLGAGKRISPIQFLSFKFRRYSGESTDLVPMTLSYSDGSPNDDFVTELKFEDTITDILLGSKFILMPNSTIHPVIAAYLGVSLTSSKILDPTGENPETKLSSSAFLAAFEGGAETMLNKNFALGGTLGYQYVTKRKFKVSDDTANQFKTFSSNRSYSNLSLQVGIKFYF